MKITYEILLKTIRGYKSSYVTQKLEYGSAMKMSEDFLMAINPGKLVAFSEIFFDEPQTKQNPQSLEGLEQATRFLQEEVSYGDDNYYMAPENLEWTLMLCHEGDLHIYGSKEIVDKFKEIANQ